MLDVGMFAARGFQRHIQRIGDVLCLHRRTELPRDYVA